MRAVKKALWVLIPLGIAVVGTEWPPALGPSGAAGLGEAEDAPFTLECPLDVAAPREASQASREPRKAIKKARARPRRRPRTVAAVRVAPAKTATGPALAVPPPLAATPAPEPPPPFREN